MSNKKFSFLVAVFSILTFALSACEPLTYVLHRLEGISGPDDTPTSCDEDAFIVTEDLDINDGECNASCSLREAILWANTCDGPDTIVLGNGFFQMLMNGTGAERGDFNITEDVVITGNGTGDTIVFGPAFWHDRIFTIEAGAHVEIRDLTIKGGNSQVGNGGAILNLGNLVLNNVIIRENKALRGGGIYNSGEATLDNVQVIDNIATGVPDLAGETGSDVAPTDQCGGGVTNAGNMTISTGYIYSNEAAIGAGICNAPGGNLTINSSTWITGNPFTEGTESTRTTIAGGGIANLSFPPPVFGEDRTASLTVEDSQVTENAAYFGGGIFSTEGSLRLDNVWIDNNRVWESGWTGLDEYPYSYPGGTGGGLFIGGGHFEITSSAITRNNAANGGGFLINHSNGEITHSSIAENQASNKGGGIYADESGELRLTNDTVGNNEARHGGGILNYYLTIMLTNVTIADNRGVAILTVGDGGSVGLQNTIIGPNEGTSCFNVADDTFGQGSNWDIWSAGNNLDSGDSCLMRSYGGGLHPLDRVNVNPIASSGHGAPSGGPSLLFYYPSDIAIDYIQPGYIDPSGTYGSWCPPDDQFGVSRPIGGGCEVGAIEYSYALTAATPSTPEVFTIWASTPPSIPTFTFTTNANCREGPSTQYEVDDSFLQGQSTQIDGRSQYAPLWWWVLRSNGDHCWVSDSTGTASGPTENVQIVEALPPPVIITITDTVAPPPPSPSPPPTQSPPSAPYKLYVQNHVCAGSTYTVTLAWGDTSDNETGFRVYRDTVLIATLGPNATSYTDSPPTGGPYYYAVEAFNDAGAAQSNSAKDDGCIF